MPPKGKVKAEAAPPEEAPAPEEPAAGEGEFAFADGSTYQGAWARAPETGAIMREGRGVLTHASIGYTYVGEWKGDQMHGYGEFTYASCAKYSGQWEGNRYNGHGTYAFPDGSAYEGGWVDNQMHGDGVFVDTKGVRWTGQYYNGTGPGLSALVV